MVVSFKIAKLLSENKISIPTENGYTERGSLVSKSFSVEMAMYNAPDVMQAVMWIFKKYSIWIEVRYDHNTNKFWFEIVGGKDAYGEPYHAESDIEFTSPEKAYEEAIKHTLNVLI